MTKIVVINGSLAKPSLHQVLLDTIQKEAPAGTEFQTLDIGSLPFFDPAQENLPAYEAVRAALNGADAVLVASPEYNSSITGALKNVIDVASRPYGQHSWMGKKVAVISTSVSAYGAVNSNKHCRGILEFLGANVLDATLHLANGASIADGQIQDAAVQEEVKQFAQKFFQFAA